MPNFKEFFNTIKKLASALLAKKYIQWPLRVLNVLQWILIPILVFIVVENLLKTVEEKKPRWYLGAEITAKNHEVDYVFIGSSRVAAAVREQVFMEGMSAQLGQKVVAINLGRGYSTIQQHYLGLRNLLEKYPDSFKNFTVFFEAPGGIVNYYYYSMWNFDWVNSDQSQLLIPLLRPADLFHFLFTSSEKLDTKTYVLLKYYLNQYKIIRFRERVKEGIDTLVMEWLDKTLENRFHIPPAMPEKKLDLTESGGIRVNSRNLFESQVEAERFVAEELKRLRLRQSWETTVFGELVRMIESHNGKVMFFNMPVFSIRERVFKTKIHLDNTLIFTELLKKWDAVVLFPDFKYNDSDFPDSSHLRYSRSPEFSRKLTAAYIQYLKTK